MEELHNETLQERAVLVVCGILLAVFVIMFAPPADPGR